MIVARIRELNAHDKQVLMDTLDGMHIELHNMHHWIQTELKELQSTIDFQKAVLEMQKELVHVYVPHNDQKELEELIEKARQHFIVKPKDAEEEDGFSVVSFTTPAVADAISDEITEG